MSRTRSSVVAPSSTTTIRRPWGANAACRCSTPKRASRSRCSTTITLAEGSDKIRARFWALAVQTRPDFGHHLADLHPGSGGPPGGEGGAECAGVDRASSRHQVPRDGRDWIPIDCPPHRLRRTVPGRRPRRRRQRQVEPAPRRTGPVAAQRPCQCGACGVGTNRQLPEMQRRATEVAARRKELQHKRTSLADERTELASNYQLRRRLNDFAARIHAVIDASTTRQKQQLLRLLIADDRVTGWHVQIPLRIALDPPLPEPPHPAGPKARQAQRTNRPPSRLVSTQGGLRSLAHH
jgi:hypothetical protein